MRIKKYKIKSLNSEEVEFEVTKVTETKTTLTVTQKVDGEGNLISARNGIKTSSQSDVKEGISAVSLPSRTPAEVEILETFESPAELRAKEEIESPSRPKPIRTNMNKGGREESINITEKFNQEDGSKAEPIPVPKSGDIKWV